jgi:dipeptidase D
LELKVSGLLGGHSGVDIHLPRGNANKIIARILSALSKNCEICICHWNGGLKHNVITRESEIKFCVPKDKVQIIKRAFEKEKQNIMQYYKGSPIFEPNLSIILKDSFPAPYFSPEDSIRIIITSNLIPHGVIRMDPTINGLVETSNNFAVVKTEENKIEFIQAARSNIDFEIEAFRNTLEDIAKLGGWDIIHLTAYPGWKPDPESSFLKFISKIYEDNLKKLIKIEAIHAGLETGVIGAKFPGMQMVSLGPTIKNAHTPDEKLNIVDVKIMYEILKEILMKFCSF